MRVLKVKVISLPFIFQVLLASCFTRPRYQVSVYRTIGPLVFVVVAIQAYFSMKFYLANNKRFMCHDAHLKIQLWLDRKCLNIFF